MIGGYLYWIAVGDRAFGEGDERRIAALRAVWESHRLVDEVSPFDGASFWTADGQSHARVIRTARAGAAHPVQVIDVDPALVLDERP